MKKDYIKNLSEKAERRNITHKVEMRQMEGEVNPTISGTAAIFNTTTDMGWYIEQVDSKAFDTADMTDVVALFNHDDDEILSRTTGQPDDLILTIDSNGLMYEFKAKNECALEVAQNIQLGFIKGSSFAFTCNGEMWEYDVVQEDGTKKDVRTITSIEKVYDVSPVTWPAYQDTDVAARSKNLNKPKATSGKEFIYELRTNKK
jgi:HK97 family phage prohead protease